MSEKHLIIDGPNLIHRAFWIADQSKNASDTLYILIALRSIKMYIERFAPTRLWCAWDHRIDRSEQSIRKEASSEYKQTRDHERNARVHEYTDDIIKVFEYIGFTNIQPYRGEADDIIAYLSHNLEGKKVIVTADTDILQLITDDTVVFSPIKKVEFDLNAFIKKYDMYPEQYPLYKSIVGDKSDNITGLYKFGDKKARRVIDDEILLTDDQKELVKENMKLIDLLHRDGDDWQIEFDYYKSCVDKSNPVPDSKSFKEMCEYLNLNSIVDNFSEWHSAFFMKSAVVNVLSKLFAD